MGHMIPPLADLIDSARVVTLPMHSRFRGVEGAGGPSSSKDR